MAVNAERLSRHLRQNRGVRIKLYGSVVPREWVPHAKLGAKIGEPVMNGAWRAAYARWKKEMRVGCLAMQC